LTLRGHSRCYEDNNPYVRCVAGGTATASLPVAIVVRAFDLATQQVSAVGTRQLLQDGITPILRSDESITGCAVLGDGTVFLAITPAPGSQKEAQPTRLTKLSATATSLALAGLRKDEYVADLLAAANGSLIGIVGRRGGRPPTKLVTIDPSTERVGNLSAPNTPASWTLRGLAQAPNGKMYTTVLGYAELVRWTRQYGDLAQVGIEGTGSYGAGLARWLRARNVAVVEGVQAGSRSYASRTGAWLETAPALVGSRRTSASRPSARNWASAMAAPG
jgi:hypothetical protein